MFQVLIQTCNSVLAHLQRDQSNVSCCLACFSWFSKTSLRFRELRAILLVRLIKLTGHIVLQALARIYPSLMHDGAQLRKVLRPRHKRRLDVESIVPPRLKLCELVL